MRESIEYLSAANFDHVTSILRVALNLQIGDLHSQMKRHMAFRAHRQIERAAKRPRLQGPDKIPVRQRHAGLENVGHHTLLSDT